MLVMANRFSQTDWVLAILPEILLELSSAALSLELLATSLVAHFALPCAIKLQYIYVWMASWGSPYRGASIYWPKASATCRPMASHQRAATPWRNHFCSWRWTWAGVENKCRRFLASAVSFRYLPRCWHSLSLGTGRDFLLHWDRSNILELTEIAILYYGINLIRSYPNGWSINFNHRCISFS